MTAQDSSQPLDRVAKVLARAGVASRRDVERLIGEGRVAINGQTLTTPAVKVEPGDIVTVDGEVVGGAEPTRVFRYHKPVGLMTSHNDPMGRPTVFETLPDNLPRVISIGRLDINSEGLLLLTNDGGLSRALELPSSGWVRRYRARAFGSTTQETLDGLRDGITIDGVRYGPIEAKLDKAQGRNVWITVTLTEGKNREVRRVLEALDLKVNRLIRLAYGPFSLSTLAPGEVEEIGPRVIRELLAEQIAPENMPTGNAVQFKGGGALRARRMEGGDTTGVAPAAIAATVARAAKVRPGQETGERLSGERQPKKAGWAKAKPKPPGGMRTPKKPGAAAAKKHWSETQKGAKLAGPRGPGPAAGARGARPGPKRK